MTIQEVIELIHAKCDMDLSVFSTSFLTRTLEIRIKETASCDLDEYIEVIISNPGEAILLNNALHINYSLFFRNSGDMSLLEGFVMPDLLQHKAKQKSKALRIWSVGCAEGHEAYSLAMLADRVMHERECKLQMMIFGTDILADRLAKARLGTYDRSSLQNVKLSYIDSYFISRKLLYTVIDPIRGQVDFSIGDIVDPAFASPPAGLFASFDLVCCCNMMIYYNRSIQFRILEKLYRSLDRNGYLLVDESERLIVEKFGKFRLISPYGNIFLKK
ncbi:MAG: CheR family methyltransferase [Bacteroidales bacterium]|nr:CheR family methyltransferase [Bacteroidales bacterium]